MLVFCLLPSAVRRRGRPNLSEIDDNGRQHRRLVHSNGGGFNEGIEPDRQSVIAGSKAPKAFYVPVGRGPENHAHREHWRRGEATSLQDTVD